MDENKAYVLGLLQLCDALAGSEGVLDIEERMQDVIFLVNKLVPR